MLPVAAHVPLAGSYNSAVASDANGDAPIPPATSTRPSVKRTAAADWRAARMGSVRVHSPVAGSYSSAEFHMRLQRFPPPATSTWPSARRAMAGLLRATCMLPVSLHSPVAGS